MNGVVAAGHPLTAEAGAEILREGGNAVDAAVGAVLASFAVESPLTGFGAGGFMMVHSSHAGSARRASRPAIDFFVAAPGAGRGRAGGRAGPGPGPLRRRDRADVLRRPGLLRRARDRRRPGAGAASASARCRSGLVAAGVRLAREGAPVNAEQAYILDILAPIHERLEGTRELYAPGGQPLREGDDFRFPELAEALERFGAEGAEPFYRGEVAAALSEFVVEHGGTLGAADLAAYEAIERRPIRAPFRGTEVLTNPPPSSGGILIAYCLGLLERLGERSGPEQLVAAMGAANDARGDGVRRGALRRGAGGEPARPGGLDLAAGDLLGSTTHISVLDGDGMCASVTCSNGSGSGVLVPGTGVILNNMLGEEDLNPLGFHAIEPGRRVPSMMAPTVVLRDGEIELGLGSAGSNRIRSAILQTIVRAVEQGMRAGRRCGRRGCTSSRASSRPSPESTRRRWRGSRRAACRSCAARDQPLLRRRAGGRARSGDRRSQRRRRPAPRRRGRDG